MMIQKYIVKEKRILIEGVIEPFIIIWSILINTPLQKAILKKQYNKV